MPIVPYSFVTQEQIEAEVSQATGKLGPEVVRVRHSMGEDHDGDPAIFFRIVIADAAAKRGVIGPSISAIERTLIGLIDPSSRWGLIPYVNYRSASEQLQLNDPEWS